MNRLGTCCFALMVGFSWAGSASAQGGTDVWLIPLVGSGEELGIGQPSPVTTRPGYDNQPAFSLDGSVLYYTANVDGQTDIWRVEIDGEGRKDGEPEAFTRTPESEYSAAEIPDRGRIAVVRVEADSTQRLWSFDLSGADPRVELADVAPVGYHAWSTTSIVGMFVLGSPARFMLAEAPDGVRRTVAERIGRSIHRVPGHVAVGLGDPLLSFTTVLGDGTHVVSTFRPDGFDPAGVTSLPAGVQDYAWLPDRSIVAGDGTVLLRWSEANGWTELGDLGIGDFRLGTISRIAVHPGGRALAVVVGEP